MDFDDGHGAFDYLGEEGNSWEENLHFVMRTGTSIYKQRNTLFASDPSKTVAGRTWQIASRFTWELPQTLIGMAFYDVYAAFEGLDASEDHNGAVLIKSPRMRKDAGMTIGNYIFVGPKPADWLKSHEFGQMMQSRLLGPSYLAIMVFSVMTAPFNFHIDMPYEVDATHRGFRFY